MMRSKINLLGLGFVALVIILWQLLTLVGPLAGLQTFPSPVDVVKGGATLISDGSLLDDLLHTLWVTVVSAAIGLAAGLVLGLLLGLVYVFRIGFGASLDVLRTIPMVALMPVALLLWGPEPEAEIVVAAIAATWPMMVNTAGGIAAVHPRILEVGRMFGLSTPMKVLKLYIPAASSQILVGARLGVVTALVAAIVTEMLIVPFGLGARLISAELALQYGQMWAAVVVCGTLGYLLNALLIAGVNKLDGSKR